jgi:hypothetical protein
VPSLSLAESIARWEEQEQNARKPTASDGPSLSILCRSRTVKRRALPAAKSVTFLGGQRYTLLCMKRYLRAVPVSPSIIEGYVVELKDSIEWVDSPDEATADYRVAVEVTQKKLKEQLGLETELVEIPYPRQMESKWVISKEDT